MKVLRSKVVELAENLGYKAAGKWNKTRMEEKLLSLAELDPEGEEIEALEDPEQAKLLKSIIECEGVVDVVSHESELAEDATEGASEEGEAELEEEAEEEEPAKVEKKTEKKAPKPKMEKAPKAKAEKKADRFGSRLGSQASAINAVLTSDEMSIEDIASLSKQNVSRVKSHIKSLVIKKYVGENNGKFSVLS